MDEENQRRKLRFRSWNFGTRELDFLLGSFADKHLDSFDSKQLEAYERLLAEPLPDLFAWITGAAEVPTARRSEMLKFIIAFCRDAHQKYKE
jgi:antitoxin CptB